MGKGKKKKRQFKAIAPSKEGNLTTTLFCYGTLNVHDVQRGLWGEAKEGKDGILHDYELKMWPNSTIFYIERKVGESVVGKAYELTKEQLEATDVFETDAYKRVTVSSDNGSFDTYVRNPETSVQQMSLTQ